MRSLLLMLLATVLLGCPPADNPFICTTDCDGGSSDSGAGGGSGGGAGGSGGGTGGSAGGGGAGGGSSDGGCVEQWQCSPWQVTDAGTALRTCTDLRGCGTTAQKPAVGPAALPALDLPYFKCEVQPVLERSCSMIGCHGTLTDRSFRMFSRGRLRNSEQVPQVSSCLGGGMLDLSSEGTGTVMCLGWSRLTATEWKKNFDNARTFSIGVTNVADNELLTEPLEGNYRAHAGVKPFTLTDPGYLKVKSWLSGSTAPANCDAGFN